MNRYHIFFAATSLAVAGLMVKQLKDYKWILNLPAEPKQATVTLTHNELHANCLSTEVLQDHQDLLMGLSHTALNEEALKSLEEPLSKLINKDVPLYACRDLMSYVVSCALPDGQSVKSPVPNAAGSFPRWKGEVGLCPGWAQTTPGTECQELVSSCVLSRANALGKRVTISMRGPKDIFSSLEPAVKVEKELREHGGTPIASFKECPTGSSSSDCGWKPAYVGRCEATEHVTVCAGATGKPATCPASSPDHTQIRVCTGLYGCDSDKFYAKDPSDPDKNIKTSYPRLKEEPRYAGAGPLASGQDSVTFVCPRNGPIIDKTTYGYYSVMIKPPASSDADAIVKSVGATAGEYPASEGLVFTWGEGAFFGNIFSRVRGSMDKLPQSMYACYSDGWDCSLAHMADRLCAGKGNSKVDTCLAGAKTTETCFGNTPVPCHNATASNNPLTCSNTDTQLVDSCWSEGQKWQFPITVYLNHPCDLSGETGCKYEPFSQPNPFPPR